MSEENPTFEADTGKRGGESLMDTSTLLDLEQALTGLQDKSLSPAQAAETIRKEMQKQMEMQQDPTKMLNQLWGDITGANDEPDDQVIEKKPSAKAGGKTVRRAKRD